MFEWIKSFFKKPDYDMRSLQFHLYVAKLAYPSLYATDAQVLNHLYLVIGNGYEWADGVLVGDCDTTYDKVVKMLLAGKSEKKIKRYVEDEARKRWGQMFAATDKEYQKLRKKLGLPDYNYEESKAKSSLSPYPICEYSKLMSIPPDALPDWVAGAYEAAKLAVVFDSYDERDTKENAYWVAKAVERLDRTFGAFNRPKRQLYEVLG